MGRNSDIFLHVGSPPRHPRQARQPRYFSLFIRNPSPGDSIPVEGTEVTRAAIRTIRARGIHTRKMGTGVFVGGGALLGCRPPQPGPSPPVTGRALAAHHRRRDRAVVLLDTVPQHFPTASGSGLPSPKSAGLQNSQSGLVSPPQVPLCE